MTSSMTARTMQNGARRVGYIALAAAACVVVTGCALFDPEPRTAPDAQGRPAALARLVVVNETGRALEVGFVPAAEAGGAVVVGRVDAGDTALMAPVPAQEPIRVFARDDAAIAWLPPQSFEIDEEWTWRIDGQTSFEPR